MKSNKSTKAVSLMSAVFLPESTPVCLAHYRNSRGVYQEGVTVDQLQANQRCRADTQDTLLIGSDTRLWRASLFFFWWSSFTQFSRVLILRLIYQYSTTASRPLNTIVHRRDVWSLKAFRVPVQGTSTESVSCISKYHCCTIIETWHGSAPFPQYCALRSLSMQLSLDHRKKLIEDTLPLYGKHVWEGFQITLPEIKSST